MTRRQLLTTLAGLLGGVLAGLLGPWAPQGRAAHPPRRRVVFWTWRRSPCWSVSL